MTPPSSLSVCLVLPCFQRRNKRRQLLQRVLCSDEIQQSSLQKWENLHQWQTTGKYSYCCLVAVYGDKSGHVLCCSCHNYIKKGKKGNLNEEALCSLSLLQVRVYCDQWRRPRAPQSQSPSSDPQKSDTPTASPSHSTPVTPVLTPKKKLATEVLRKLKVDR